MELASLSLEQKIGQLFICGFHTLIPDRQALDLIQKHHVGGIVYFRRNVESAAQLAKLSHALQRTAVDSGGIPLLIAIDQEGGMVSRLDHEGISRIPGNMTLGAADDPSLTQRVAALAARELGLLGINMNFAPCVDVNNNPANPVIGVRSFSEDPHKVAVHGAAAVRGYQANGILATAKHFPGHGDTTVDSHRGLASVPHGRQRLESVELLPFREAIAAGVQAVMTAHVIFPSVEPDGLPATLSRRVLTDLLRGELGFKGLIVTDCLEMKAISDEYGVAEGAVMALAAGADLVLVSHTYEEQRAAIAAVKEAVLSGRLAENALDQSVARVLAVKENLNPAIPGPAIPANPAAPAVPATTPAAAPAPAAPSVPLLPEQETVPLLKEATRLAVTLVKNEGGVVPLDRAVPTLAVWPELRHRTEVDERAVLPYTLEDALKPLFPRTAQVVVGTIPEPEEIEQVLSLAVKYKQIIVATYTSEGTIPDGQAVLVRELLKYAQAHNVRLVVASMRNPYDLNAFPEIPAYLCIYENRPYSLDALARVLAGEGSVGKLPVSLNGEFSIGVGL